MFPSSCFCSCIKLYIHSLSHSEFVKICLFVSPPGPSVLSDSLENPGAKGERSALCNLNVTAYIQNLRQYISKPSHNVSTGKSGEGMGQEDQEVFEYKLRRAASKESWDNKSSKVRES